MVFMFPMRVLFDVSGLDHMRISGVGTYVRHLGQALLETKGLQVEGAYRLSRWRRLHVIRRHWLGPVRAYFPYLMDITPRDCDLFHGPDFRLPNLRGVKRVVTIHDLAFYERGYTQAKFAAQRIELAEHVLGKLNPEAVIAVSNFTRDEILKRFPKLAGRVHTVWHGADHLLIPANRGPRPIAEPYFLFVGNLEARKNLVGLIRGFALLKNRPEHKNTRLVLVGKEGFGFDEIKQVCRDVSCSEHIVLPGFISNMGLVNYYQWAEAFVYPSFYEGFGFPVLEAMRLGCPVVTSKTSACPEIAGDAAVLVDPYSAESIAEGMLKMSDDQSLRTQLIERGQIRGVQFRWQDCGAQTVNVYKEALRSSSVR